MQYDLIVVGAGPAGLTAAIYARRAGKTVLLIERAAFGGQMTYSPKIENYPGFEALSGNELADKMVSHALALGAETEIASVTGIRTVGKGKVVLTDDGGCYECKTVILATGAKHRMLRVPGESEMIGHGVSFCAVCDGAFYAGKDVAVIGGGNSALQEAVLLSSTSAHVTVVQNRAFFTGEATLLEKLRNMPNVTLLTDHQIIEIVHEDGVLKGVKLRTADGEKLLRADGVFIAIGLEPDNRPFEETVRLDSGYVLASEDCMTSCPGVFTAGDCRRKEIRQIATAVSDGAVAALAACRYIDEKFA